MPFWPSVIQFTAAGLTLFGAGLVKADSWCGRPADLLEMSIDQAKAQEACEDADGLFYRSITGLDDQDLVRTSDWGKYPISYILMRRFIASSERGDTMQPGAIVTMLLLSQIGIEDEQMEPARKAIYDFAIGRVAVQSGAIVLLFDRDRLALAMSDIAPFVPLSSEEELDCFLFADVYNVVIQVVLESRLYKTCLERYGG